MKTKEIPCRRCRKTATGPPTPAHPAGEPIRFSRFTGGEAPIVLKCYRCGDSLRLDVLTFNALPFVEVD